MSAISFDNQGVLQIICDLLNLLKPELLSTISVYFRQIHRRILRTTLKKGCKNSSPIFFYTMFWSHIKIRAAGHHNLPHVSFPLLNKPKGSLKLNLFFTEKHFMCVP